MRIAYLEDDPDQAKLVMIWMRNAGHQYQHFAQGRKFIKSVFKESFDVIILDWELLDLSGIEVLKWIREYYDAHIPVLFITVRESEKDIVEALEAGADDYLVKPVGRGEFTARINALHRRSQSHADEDILPENIYPYEFDDIQETIDLHGEKISLTKMEYCLAKFLFQNISRVVSRDHIMQVVWGVWGGDFLPMTRTLDTHISRIRHKLDLTEKNGWRLESIYKHGYVLTQL